jgi:hypothetical protein
MIHDVDASIRALIRRDAVNGDVEVAFEAPTREWSAKRSAPTIDVFLFDIREDVGRRRVEPEPVRDEDGMVTGRRRPPRRYRLSYLVTAWTQRAEDEHRLLSAVLGAFLPHEELPRELLVGALAEPPLPLLMTIGLPPPAERSIGEIWSAMGGELKPSLELVISAPFTLAELQHAGPPVLEDPRFEFDDGTGWREVVPATHRRPFPGAPLERTPQPEAVDGGPEEEVSGGPDGTGRVLRVSTLQRRS